MTNFIDVGIGIAAMLAAALFALAIVAVIITLFGLSNARRLRRAVRTFPSALIVPVAPAPLLALQSRALMTALGLTRSRVTPWRYATLVADEHSVRFLTGSATDQPAAAFPSNLVRGVALGSVQMGARIMTSIDIEVVTSGGTLVLPVTPMRRRGNWLRAVPDADIAILADDLRRATGDSRVRS